MFFNKKKPVHFDQVNVAYKQNECGTKCLFVYNTGTHTLKTIVVTLINNLDEKFNYQTNPISPRSNEVVNFGKSGDLSGKLFSGGLVKVIVKTNELSFVFKPNEKNIFEKSR